MLYVRLVRSAAPAFIAFYLLFFVWAIALQIRSGTYQSEFGHYPDEPGHVVSALMIHDYIASGFRESPMHYAEVYYIHYPKVAIGVYPPVFHLMAALWMFAFSATHTSMLVFMAAHCALLTTLIAWFVRRRFGGDALAALVGLLFISFFLIQYGTSLFMLDIMISLVEFVATLLLIRFFKTENVWDALWFGVAASVAMLIKGNAIALILMPPFMIVGLWRWSILKRSGLYVSAAAVLLIGLPWQMATINMLKGTVPVANVTLPYIAGLLAGYLKLIVESTGYVVLAVAAIGLIVEFRRARQTGRRDERVIEMMGLVAMAWSVYLFHSVSPYPGPESRYISPVMVAIVVFFAAGIFWIANRFPVRAVPHTWRPAALAAVLIGIYAATSFSIPTRPPLGYIPAAQALRKSEMQDRVILICGDSFAEGALVTQVALEDRRPDRIVLRGSKVLSEGRWSVRVYRPLLNSSEEVQKYLLSVPIDAVVIDLTAPLWEQETQMLLKTMRANTGAWRLSSEVPAGKSERHILIYRHIGPRDPATKRDIELRMRFMLGRDLKL